ncbi:MAG TPA: Gfo/Idh/MocA family oxidoreductase [Abditibacteriaceae bacterium]|jgi:predicted dehydrogenase
MSTQKLKVAVIGASGIGKNHARWFHGHGCDVVAFVGSSPESVASTQKVLEQGFGFNGRGYHDLQEMLQVEKPDAVCISSPPQLHHSQAILCLGAGAHVLCEKPLVGDEARPAREMIAEAQHLVQEAEKSGLVFGTQMQYATAVQHIRNLAGLAPDEPVRDWMMEMETKTVRPGRGDEKIWIDLSPHPLSVLQKWDGHATIDWSSVQCEVQSKETDARFNVALDGGVCAARVVVRVNPDRATPLRRFIINERTIEYSARNNQHGQFHTFLKSDDGREVELRDLVDILIGNFVAACRGQEPLLVSGADGAKNVEWQLKILEAASKS